MGRILQWLRLVRLLRRLRRSSGCHKLAAGAVMAVRSAVLALRGLWLLMRHKLTPFGNRGLG